MRCNNNVRVGPSTYSRRWSSLWIELPAGRAESRSLKWAALFYRLARFQNAIRAVLRSGFPSSEFIPGRNL